MDWIEGGWRERKGRKRGRGKWEGQGPEREVNGDRGREVRWWHDLLLIM